MVSVMSSAEKIAHEIQAAMDQHEIGLLTLATETGIPRNTLRRRLDFPDGMKLNELERIDAALARRGIARTAA
jgi:hypothetical protein